MYISPAQKRRQLIIALAGILFIPAAVGAFLFYRDWRSRASPEEVPQQAYLSDMTETSVVISWITPQEKREGWIQWSQTPGVSSGSPVTQDDRDIRNGKTETRTTHYVTLTDLQPDTSYYFVIGSGKNAYKDKDGAEFTFKTPPLSDEGIPTPNPLFGSIEGGEDEQAIVYVVLENANGQKSFPVSTLTNQRGNFEVDLSHIRTSDTRSRFSYTDTTKLYLFAQGGDLGGALEELTVADKEDVDTQLEEGVSGDAVMPDTAKLPVADTDDVEPCTPQCDGKECGSDGCGSTCGTCDDDATCSVDGVCEVCEPDCDGKECGSDGCGSTCGTCDDGATCSADGVCEVCEPDCDGRECGSNGCGGSCGMCDNGYTCNVSGVCEEGPCVPNCAGRVCGNDGCGGSCGTCSNGLTCSLSGSCEKQILPPSNVQDVPLSQLIPGGTSPSGDIESITLANVTENSFTVSWISSALEEGSVLYGESADDISNEALDTRDNLVTKGRYYTHHVTVTGLTPETTYYYEIQSGGELYNDGGYPYELLTPETESSPPAFYAVIGEISGSAKADSTIIAKITGTGGQSSLVSTDVGSDGTWSLSLGGVRTQDYTDYFTFTPEDTLELTVKTKGNQLTRSYLLADIEDDLISIQLNMIESGQTGFDRGIYAEIGTTIDELPITAINRVTVMGLSLSAALIVSGLSVFLVTHRGAKNERWEQGFLKKLENE